MSQPRGGAKSGCRIGISLWLGPCTLVGEISFRRVTGLGQDQVRAPGQKRAEQKANQWSRGDRRWEGGTTKGHGETLGRDRYVHFLDCGDSFMDVYVRQNSSHCTLLMFS